MVKDNQTALTMSNVTRLKTKNCDVINEANGSFCS